MENQLISLVIPVYNEASALSASIDEIHKVLENNNINYELIIVDDGSTDDTWKIITEMHWQMQVPVQAPMQIQPAHPSRLTGLRLSRNFGKESALCAGLDSVSGTACIVMDADLQHPPSLIPQILHLWRAGYDIVECVKNSRSSESIFGRITACIFYSTLKHLSGLNLKGASDYKLIDSKVLENYRRMPEHSTFFRGLSAWVGYKRVSIYFDVPPRVYGKSRWSKIKLLRLAISAITAYSSLPLQLVTLMGIIFLAGSFALAIQTLYKYFAGIAFTGFTTVILLLLIIGSTLMISLGIIGTYISRIYEEVKNRPRYIISETTTTELQKNCEPLKNCEPPINR